MKKCKLNKPLIKKTNSVLNKVGLIYSFSFSDKQTKYHKSENLLYVNDQIPYKSNTLFSRPAEISNVSKIIFKL